MMTATKPKEITTKVHEDGRKDVHIEVNKLDLDPNNPIDQESKDMIENKVFARLSEQQVLVIVLHKPTNQEAHHVVSLPQVRAFAEVAVRKFLGEDGLYYTRLDEFAIIQNNLTTNTVKVTTL